MFGLRGCAIYENLSFYGGKGMVITLIGKRQAYKGYKFVYLGENEVCEDCEYRIVCHKNLEVSHVYEVKEVRNMSHPCKIHQEGVVVVEVEEAPLKTSLDSKKAIEGTVIKYKKRECDEVSCENYNLCLGFGLFEGNKYKILNVGNKIKCLKGDDLVEVTLKRVY
ncbi:MAG: UPF0179 family protein [Candidatus Asgardarchaeia archaeon]